MRSTLTLLCLLAAVLPPGESPGCRPASDPAGPSQAPQVDLPIHFVANAGQWQEPVAMVALGGSATTWVFDDGFAQRFERWQARDDLSPGRRGCVGAVVRTRFAGAGGEVGGEDPVAGRFQFLRNGRSITQEGFARARIRELLAGVDLVLRPQAEGSRELAYDLHLQPWVDLADITAECEGAASLSVADDGALCVAVPLPGGELVTMRQSPPIAWQPSPAGDRPVAMQFRLLGGTRYGFAAEGLEDGLPLVIDPGIIWSTLLGGGAPDSIHDLDWLPGHGIWVGGYSGSTDFPTTLGAFQLFGGTDGFVARLEEDGRTLVWATYLGGSSGEEVRGIAVDAAQTVAVVGWTRSLDFPIVAGGAFQPQYGGASPVLDIGDGFYARLSADGSALLGGTYLGGGFDDVAEDVAVNAAGEAFVTGWTNSPNFPTTPGSFQSKFVGPPTLQTDGFVARLDLDGRNASYSTYLGGTASEQLLAIQLDASSRATLTGFTISDDFPTSSSAYQPVRSEVNDAVLCRLEADGSQLLFSTYLGGTGFDIGTGVALAPDGSIWMTGTTQSDDMPSTAGALQPALTGNSDAFLAHLSVNGDALAYLTYLGGDGEDQGRAVALLPDGSPVVVGDTSLGLPVTAGAPQSTFGGGSQDAYVTVLEPAGDALRFSTLLGGTSDDFLVSVAVAPAGTIAVGGFTFGEDFPTTAGALQETFGGVEDGVIAMLDPDVQVAGVLDVSVYAAGGNAVFSPMDVAESLGLRIVNHTPRVLMGQTISVFVGTTGDPSLELDGVSLWIDEPGVAGSRDLLIDGPLPVTSPAGVIDLSLVGLPSMQPDDELLLRFALHSTGNLVSGSEYQCVLLGPESVTMQAQGAGTGPQVAVVSQGRLASGVSTAVETRPFPGDSDGDGLLTVGDLRRLCRNLGNAVPPAQDPDGNGQLTVHDAVLLRDAILERPIVSESPPLMVAGDWVRLSGYFPDTVPVVTLGGSSTTIGAATPRGLSFRVAADQVSGPQDLVITYGNRQAVVLSVTVQ